MNNPIPLKKVVDLGSKFIDYKIGLVGACVMGCIVFVINDYHTHNLSGASTAALKQGAYTLLFGGSIMRGCEYLATRITKRAVALVAAVILPSVVAVSLTFGVHSMKGTPKPLESTIPTAILIIPSTAIWGHRKREEYKFNQNNEQKQIIS
jgi:hypothetical protein